ncbi:hypothetical protein SAMD00023353_2000660 [Rosellinia necatrix]|uniref:Uncharacterized protein n=1 Tax=Rosellinia necatrix TaxID=77044 RepID=A0A1S8A7M8_ROSNE|nr:hypothetical protein SAMD00023353_2000660 [Rosellinia necatrix]
MAQAIPTSKESARAVAGAASTHPYRPTRVLEGELNLFLHSSIAGGTDGGLNLKQLRRSPRARARRQHTIASALVFRNSARWGFAAANEHIASAQRSVKFSRKGLGHAPFADKAALSNSFQDRPG